MFTLSTNKTTKAVKYTYKPSIPETVAGRQLTWTFDHPGSYAPGYENLRYETLPLVSVGFSLFRERALAPWEVRGIVIECQGAGGSTVLLTVSPDAPDHPEWLTKIIAKAVKHADS